MTGTEKLRKENQSLRNEIADLKAKLQKISENVDKDGGTTWPTT